MMTINGRQVALEAVIAAAHQDDPAWLMAHGYEVPPQDAETQRLAEFYRAELVKARAREEDARRARASRCAGHRAASSRGPLPFSGPVSRDENPAAHGGVRHAETCRCGAVRELLVNGHHEEVGPWR